MRSSRRFRAYGIHAWAIATLAGVLSSVSPTSAQLLPLPEDLIALDSDAGAALLFDSEARTDFLPLTQYFETQDNLAYCGVASMVMVLNALGVEAPLDPAYGTFHFFTQDNLFDNPQTQAVLPAEVVAQQGMTLDELGGLLASYPVQVEVHHAAATTLDTFRTLVLDNLQQPDNYILVNYLRSAIGQQQGGHISPLAAYDVESDRVLILDVSRYKYPPIWVTTEDLWNAMDTVDSSSNQTRGFVLVSR